MQHIVNICIHIYTNHMDIDIDIYMDIDVRIAENKRPICQLSSKRLEDNWHSGLLSSTKQRLSGVRLPVGRKWSYLDIWQSSHSSHCAAETASVNKSYGHRHRCVHRHRRLYIYTWQSSHSFTDICRYIHHIVN